MEENDEDVYHIVEKSVDERLDILMKRQEVIFDILVGMLQKHIGDLDSEAAGLLVALTGMNLARFYGEKERQEFLDIYTMGAYSMGLDMVEKGLSPEKAKELVIQMMKKEGHDA